MRKVIKTIQPILWAIVFVAVSALGISSSVSAYSIQEGVNAARGTNQPSELFGAGGVITTVTNTLLFIVGALSVIMIIFGGLRYVVSGGNSTAVSAAKNTILYAIVGLVIAFLAFAAVNFILGNLEPGTGAGYTNI
ncbi:MAG: hypothetical protein ABIP50_00665 [Candidatus Saccharimonadales bacterium]